MRRGDEARRAGAAGERRLAREAARLMPGARVFTNVYVPRPRGAAVRDSEVDVVAVCADGVFALEMKNYAGRVTGSARERSWTQAAPGEVRRFQNPVAQNEGHMEALSQALGLSRALVHGAVVFADGCDISGVDRLGSEVVRLRGLAGALERLSDESRSALSEPEVRQVAASLAGWSGEDEARRERHIREVEAVTSGKGPEGYGRRALGATGAAAAAAVAAWLWCASGGIDLRTGAAAAALAAASAAAIVVSA